MGVEAVFTGLEHDFKPEEPIDEIDGIDINSEGRVEDFFLASVPGKSCECALVCMSWLEKPFAGSARVEPRSRCDLWSRNVRSRSAVSGVE